MSWIVFATIIAVLLMILFSIKMLTIGMGRVLDAQKLHTIAMAEIHRDIHTMRTRQLNDAMKISHIKEFCDEYSWRLVHFTDQELADLAYEEAERH